MSVSTRSIGVRDLCACLDVSYRDVRYVMEQGILPAGVDKSPGRGEHRKLTTHQALWLAIVLTLKASGVNTPLAGRIADFTKKGLTALRRQGATEVRFDPFHDAWDSEGRLSVEIGDLRLIRIVSDDDPHGELSLVNSSWLFIDPTKLVSTDDPLVVIRLDLGGLVRRLRTCFLN